MGEIDEPKTLSEILIEEVEAQDELRRVRPSTLKECFEQEDLL
jgi:hypothetical protein